MDDKDSAAWDREVLSARGTTATIGDVIRSGYFRGELEPCWRRVLAFAKSRNGAAESRKVELQASSEEFRTSRDLITAEETEQWLEERGLTLEDFTNFLLRNLQYDALTAISNDPKMIDYAFAPAILRDILRIDLLLSGEFDRLAIRFAWRLAASEGAKIPANEDAISLERECFQKRHGLNDAMLPAWLAGLGCDYLWLDKMLELEAIFRREADALFTPGARKRMLQSLRIALTPVELELMEIDSCDAAREAFQCVVTDGESMETIARNTNYPHHRFTVFCEELPEDVQQKILFAMPGEVLEPIEHDSGFQLYRLVKKGELNLANEEVRQRVEAEIIRRHFSELAARFVHWILPPNPRT
ncbi:MAG TPA: hypothetical protein VIS99_08880 [Terrimicrobiaceae bacterium]